jgi:glycerol-3-phosphate acyltransferase PlsX
MGRLPTMFGHIHMLDLGANIDSSAQVLLEFATMGSIMVAQTQHIERPTIGLLNVGEEEMKGNEKIKQTSMLLKNSNLNYSGFIEGDDIFKGSVDLVVCDGFEGNIALKSAEGAIKMMAHYLKRAFTRNLLTKIIALIATPVLKNFKSELDPGKYNGASLLGLKGIVVKSHGSANSQSFLNAIAHARLEVKTNVIEKISKQVAQELSKPS